MADIRIKDLATTASVTASDDFMAVDGAINGTRKLSAATPSFLTSVTTPSLTSPASSPLTLGTGSSGTALTVASATGNVGIGTTTPSSALSIFNLNPIIKLQNTTPVNDLGLKFFNGGGTALGGIVSDGTTGGIFLSPYNFSNAIGIAPTTGNVSIASTTAGSSGAGALVISGGLSAAGASYFGANVVARGALGYATGIHSGATADSSQQLILSSSGGYSNAYVSKNGTTLGIGFSSSNGSFVEDNALSIVAATKAATFAGAVAIGNTVATGVAVASTHKVTMVIGGVTYYLLASNV